MSSISLARDDESEELTMVWRFLKHYGVGKAGDMLDEFASAVVAFDPDNAGKAQIAMMQAELNKLAKRLAEAEAELRREHRETEELQRSYQRYFEAARLLEQKLAHTENDAERNELEASLAKLVDQLEQLKPELAREQEEDREAEIWARELRASFEGLAAKLRTAESDLRSAKRRMETAKLQQQRAVERDRKEAAITCEAKRVAMEEHDLLMGACGRISGGSLPIVVTQPPEIGGPSSPANAVREGGTPLASTDRG